MLILLPPAAVGCLAVVLGAVRPAWGWRRILLRAVLLGGLYLILVTEGLGRLGLLRQAPLALAWAAPVVALAAWLVRLHFASSGPLLAALAFCQGFKWQAVATRNQLPFFGPLAPWLGAIDSRLPAG